MKKTIALFVSLFMLPTMAGNLVAVINMDETSTSGGTGSNPLTPPNPNPCVTRIELQTMMLTRADITEVNTSCITDFSYLFQDYGNNAKGDITNWDVSNGTNFSYMFEHMDGYPIL